MSGGSFVCFAGSTFAFGTRGIMFMASYWFRESIDGVITALATSPAVLGAMGADRTRGRSLSLDISDTGL